MKSKRIVSLILVLVIVFAMAATACGKKEEAAEKEEPNQEETSDTDEEEADEEEASADEVEKTGEDTLTEELTEEDIQSLKDSIRDTVISEYLEPNNISVEDFVWPDKDSDEWGYMLVLSQKYDLASCSGYEIDEMYDLMEIDSSSYSNPEIMEAAFNGIAYWEEDNHQGRNTNTFLHNVYDAVRPYNEVIPTIDVASK